MIRILRKALQNGRVTTKYPFKPDVPPDGFLGKPVIEFTQADLEKLKQAESVCPTRAISIETMGNQSTVKLSYVRCIFCGLCAEVYPEAITMTKEFELASTLKARLETSVEFVDGKFSRV
ncbi:formate hydrogenlyase complex iron-sulfur subunit, partial [Candidatus Acetothermia bacterium]|nr:formate hydrogenlyase complex iron-sulfur subunit [Candidatus Acetothermia bacterium]